MPFDALPEAIVSDVIKLRMARDRLASPGGWQQGALGLDEPQRCLIGWLLEATDGNTDEAARLVVDYVYPALPAPARKYGLRIEAVYRFNDRRSKADVVKLMDNAIGLASAA